MVLPMATKLSNWGPFGFGNTIVVFFLSLRRMRFNWSCAFSFGARMFAISRFSSSHSGFLKWCALNTTDLLLNYYMNVRFYSLGILLRTPCLNIVLINLAHIQTYLYLLCCRIVKLNCNIFHDTANNHVVLDLQMSVHDWYCRKRISSTLPLAAISLNAEFWVYCKLGGMGCYVEFWATLR